MGSRLLSYPVMKFLKSNLLVLKFTQKIEMNFKTDKTLY